MQDLKYYFNDINGNIAIKKCNNSIHSSKSHFHKEISIALVEDGQSNVKICDVVYEISGRTFLMISSNVVHECSPISYSNWKFRMLYINKEWFEKAFHTSEEFSFSYLELDGIIYSDVLSLFENVEKNNLDFENESKMIYYISMLIGLKNTDNKEYSETVKNDKIKMIKDFMEENYLNNIMLNDLSKTSKMSKYYLIKQFESNLGLSPHKFITNLRVNHAKNLLKGNKSLTEIALESAFYDQSHFIKCFKEYTGVTPKQYRMQIS